MLDATFEDRILIRELYGRYALASATQDLESWIESWSEKAIWKTSQFEAVGRAALRQTWTGIWANFSKVAAFNEVGTITVSGDNGSALSSVYELIELSAGGTLKMAGLYRDEFVREAGHWRFAKREYELLSQEPEPSA